MITKHIVSLALFITCIVTSSAVYTAPEKPEKPGITTINNSIGETKEVETSFFKKSDLRAGLWLGPAFPIGGVSDQLGMSLAHFKVFGDMLYPDSILGYATLKQGKFNLYHRYGLNLGYISYSSVDSFARDGSSNQFLFQPYHRVSYPINIAGLGVVRPYAQLGLGFVLNSISVSENGKEIASDSAFDGSILFALGSELQMPQLKEVVLMTEFSYYTAFESISGHFLSFSIGAAYQIPL